jgi:hypothetical protein
MNLWLFLTFVGFVLICVNSVELIMVTEVGKEGHIGPKSGEMFEYKDDDGFDSLSPLGKRQLYLIGAELKIQYVQEARLVPADCNVLDSYAFAMGTEGCLVSMQCLFYGLCPLETNVNIPPELEEFSRPPYPITPEVEKAINIISPKALPMNFKTMPVRSNAEEFDQIFGYKHSNELVQSHEKMLTSSEAAEVDSYFEKNLYPKLASILKKDASEFNFKTAFDPTEDLLRLQTVGLYLEDETNLLNLAKSFLFKYFENFFDPENKIKFGGQFFNLLALNMKNAAASKYNQIGGKEEISAPFERNDLVLERIKLYLYMVHDLQIQTYLNLMDLPTPITDYVPHASMLIFEVYQQFQLESHLTFEENLKNFYVKVKFNQKSLLPFNCPEEKCELDYFLQKISQKFGEKTE